MGERDFLKHFPEPTGAATSGETKHISNPLVLSFCWGTPGSLVLKDMGFTLTLRRKLLCPTSTTPLPSPCLHMDANSSECYAQCYSC